MMVYLILGMTFAFAAAVQPGPLQSYLISQALRIGWKRTIPAACAPLISDGPIIVLVMFLLSHVPVAMINILQTAGGMFLLYLAIDAWRAWKNYDSEKVNHSASGRKTFWQAVLVNFLNPGPYIGWSLVMGPLLLKGWIERPLNGIVLLAGFYTTIVLSQMGIVLLFAHAGKLGKNTNRVLIGLSAIGLACFGMYEVWSGAKYFLLQ
jgi:threonine/homoserine/homoserine lactone efflux protein